MRLGWLTAIVVVVTATANCWDASYHCTRDDQCVLHGVAGHCEANGFCSFPSDSCPSNRVYGDHSPVTGTCVAPVVANDDGGGTPCGNGALDPGELCDPAIAAPNAGACPAASDCDDHNPCTSDSVDGSAAQCSARCAHTFITACGPVDQCCAVGCTAVSDKDCSATCGDGTLDPTESCDKAIASGQLGACPTSCPSSTSCTTYTLIGDPSVCTARCTSVTISSCSGTLSSDGCCPPGCSLLNDADCA
jgi:hypothetical protein